MRLRVKGGLSSLAGIFLATAGIAAAPAASAFAPQLTRYPYLTDVVTSFATVNWGTDQSGTSGYLTYGAVGSESCTAHKVSGSKTSISVNSVAEYQWKAKLTGLGSNRRYCYRVFLTNSSGVTSDLLGSDPSPQFWSQIAKGDTTPYTFAVLGDVGYTDATGDNPYQAHLMAQLAASGARFALTTGDTAYPGGSQTNYGDLYQTGADISTFFAPQYWKNVGTSMPLFNALGNHGQNGTFIMLWPSAEAAATSGGSSALTSYCCVNGTNAGNYPSVWYAFDAGTARIYVLDASWPDSNRGTASGYKDDFDAHWAPGTPERTWLENDLAAHPGGLKLAVTHFPMYSDNATETSDTFLQGAGSLQGLLDQNGVDLLFNGHAHLYQRNVKVAGDTFTSYVTGGGGARLEPIGAKGCSATDAYGIGWSYSSAKGSRCGAAPVPDTLDRVFHYLLVSVNGATVTVTGVDSLGRQFDSVRYTF